MTIPWIMTMQSTSMALSLLLPPTNMRYNNKAASPSSSSSSSIVLANVQRTNLTSLWQQQRQSTGKTRGNSRRTGDNGNDCDAVQEASLRLSKLRMEDAILVERLLRNAVTAHRRHYGSGGEEVRIWSKSFVIAQIKKDCSKSSHRSGSSSNIGNIKQQHVLFPSVRQCNSALATFGDVGDFSRALRLFAKMRKSASMIPSRRKKMEYEEDDDIDDNDNEISGTNVTNSVIDNDDNFNSNIIKDERVIVPFGGIDMVQNPPKPTLVTYSALMSRAISLRKPKVALRLWNLMKNQVNFYTQHGMKDYVEQSSAQNSSSSSSSSSSWRDILGGIGPR